MFERYRTIHFVGIGGIGMSGIAEVLHNLGYEVTGSDMRESDTVLRLRDIGIKVFIGHRAENIDNAHVVVVSTAVSEENPEVVSAKARYVPVIPRAEMLAELGRLKYGILIAGAHGKTTTTSLVATILSHAGMDPTVVIGGKLRSLGSNARLGQGDFIVAEADESDGSFLKLSPTIAVVTNIDREHMEFFKDMDTLKNAFISFVDKVPFYGLSVLCIESLYIREILPLLHRRYLTYGLTEEADLYAFNIRKGFLSISFDAVYKGVKLGSLKLPMPGVHNVLNSLAAVAVAIELKVRTDVIFDALKGFSGIQRRCEFKGEVNGIRVFDDYGHHPSEISATLEAVMDSLKSESEGKMTERGRLVVLFQPHRYTRTRDLLHEFGRCFDNADILLLADIYAAGETPLQGISTEAVFEEIKANGHKDISYVPDRASAVKNALSRLRPRDVFLTLGAGDVWKAGEEIIALMKTQAVSGQQAK